MKNARVPCSSYDVKFFINRKNGGKIIMESSRRMFEDVYEKAKNFYNRVSIN